MMRATHFFGDVDVICDIGGQDIKVLFMQNGDIKNFRLSNQCSAGNGMLLQAMADQFGVAGHRVRRHRVRGRARAEVQLRLRRVPRLRPRQLPEGGLLEGGAARGPRAGAAEERLAVRRADPAHGRARHASSCCRAARSTTSPRVKAQVDYIKERVPGAEVFVHPHTRRGRRDRRRDRDAARGQAPRARRPSSASTRRSTSSTRRRTTRRRAATSARTSARARSSTPRRPTAGPRRYITGFSCEKGTVECEEAMLDARRGAQEADEAVPEPGRLRGEARCSGTSTTPAPMPERRRADQGRRGQEGACSASSRVRGRARRSSARAPRRGQSAAGVRIGIPRVLNI